MSSECCLKGVKDNGTSTGSITQIAGQQVYVSEPSAFDGRAVVLVTDAFGLHFINNQLISDDYAKGANVRVYVPDLFHGEPVSPDVLEDPVKRATYDWRAWIGRHNPDAVLNNIVIPLVKEIKANHGVKKIAAIGFCYGGVVSLRLSATGLIDAVAVAHPSIVKVPDDIENIKTPSLWLFSEFDPQFTADVIETTKKIMEAKKPLPSIFHYYPGVEHGFAARGRTGGEQKMVDAAADVSKQVLKFFGDYL